MVDFGAKAAADIGGIDPKLVLRNAEHECTHQQPDDMRILACGVQSIVIGGEVVLAYGSARLHCIGHKPIIDEIDLGDAGSPREGRIHCGFVTELPVVAKIIGRFVVHGTSARKGAPHVYHRRQLLQFKLHQLGGVLGLIKAFREDCDDGIADMPDFSRS